MSDESASHVNEGQVVSADGFPADAKSAEVVVPAIRAFDDPATRATANAAEQRRLATTTDVRTDSPSTNFALGVGVVVALVETEVARTSYPASGVQRNRIERGRGHPLVVNVGARQRDGDRDATPVGEHVTFGTKFAAVGRIWPREVPPLGAFTEALSREAQVQSMPRSAS